MTGIEGAETLSDIKVRCAQANYKLFHIIKMGSLWQKQRLRCKGSWGEGYEKLCTRGLGLHPGRGYP